MNIYLIIALLSFSQLITVNQLHAQNNTYHYVLKARPSAEGLYLDVSLNYTADSTHILHLPSDYYGTPDLHQWVINFKGVNGTQVLKKEAASREIIPDKRHEVHIEYTIKYDAKELDKYAYAPNVSPHYFYLAGCQWILPTNLIEQKNTYHIQLKSDKSDWVFYSSLAENTNDILLTCSFEEIISAGFGGSDATQDKHYFQLNGKKFSLFIQGDYKFDKSQVLQSFKSIITKQNSFLTDEDSSFYHITILPRSGLLAGASIPHMFYCFIDSNTRHRDLNQLVSHEYFHNWLPNKMNLKTAKGQYEFQREWFSEGFTEYFSRVFLYEMDLLTPDEFVETFNADIVSIKNNPSAVHSYADIVELAVKNQYGAAQKKLSYYRGALIALKWDYELKRKGSDLKEMMLFLFEKAKSAQHMLNDSDLFQYGRQYALDFEKDIQDYIINGNAIPLYETAFPGYTLVNREINLFYSGFDEQRSAKEKIIQGVDINGPAYRAGLRDGMQYVSRQNSNRWSNSWSKDKPYTVIIKQDTSEIPIHFFPEGRAVTVNVYTKMTN
ncbi:hypothetical protein [Lacibacter sp.]|uniref:M61 family metallopeptidase n=1 Tax=Lacibacter sp. TaxID=1915409 RepID=UPI002B4B4ABA|nr:hypothetical protein [Lacibacter sp.]HLP37964.1 hypothetical protein [Lacibacter sp.]